MPPTPTSPRQTPQEGEQADTSQQGGKAPKNPITGEPLQPVEKKSESYQSQVLAGQSDETSARIMKQLGAQPGGRPFGGACGACAAHECAWLCAAVLLVLCAPTQCTRRLATDDACYPPHTHTHTRTHAATHVATEMQAFDGLGPEVTNSRLAMLGFAVAAFWELTQGIDVFQQINRYPLITIATFVVFTAASWIPFMQGQSYEVKSGPFTPAVRLGGVGGAWG
jgi:hypothetical protein